MMNNMKEIRANFSKPSEQDISHLKYDKNESIGKKGKSMS